MTYKDELPNPYEKQIQKNTIALLKAMGYAFISEEQNKELRHNKLSDVLLKDILKKSLQDLNSYEYQGEIYKFSDKNINQAMEDLNIPTVKDDKQINAEIYDLLTIGKSYEEHLPDGNKKSYTIKYLDLKNIENNQFHFTEEFTVERKNITEDTKHRRPDIVTFINGIPLGIMELKSNQHSSNQGISQHIRNQDKDEIPDLFKFSQILLSGNNYDVKYATSNTAKKFWSVWHEKEFTSLEFTNSNNETQDFNDIFSRKSTNLDQTIYSLFKKDRFLNILNNFILYDGVIKKIARYQQFFAIKNILSHVQSFKTDGTRKGGLIWHTQGSGKSLTMVMLSKILLNKINKSKIIVVTDRKNLDSQIFSTFSKSNDMKVVKAKNGQHFLELLNGSDLHDQQQVITVIINKFEKVFSSKVQIKDPNTFILVDEAHRTQYGELHIKMKKVLPNACFLGFTGTPLLKDQKKSTIEKFGGMIDKYTIDQAERDGAVLPLLYESRLAEQEITNEKNLDKRFDHVARDLNEIQKADLKQKWAKLQKVVSAEPRLKAICVDIHTHFMKQWKNVGFKGMLATSSKLDAVRYHKLFEVMSDLNTAVIISDVDTREGNDEVGEQNSSEVAEHIKKIKRNFKSLDAYENETKNAFADGDESIDILIVVDKLLTGFDAPPAVVLYIDKPLQNHSLLQAIARINRLHEGKEFGYIIDYRGLFEKLDKALTSYSSLNGFEEGDINNCLTDISEKISDLKSVYSRLIDLFHKDVKNKTDLEEYEVLLADEKLREEFLSLFKEFSKLMKIALSSEKIYNELGKKDIDQYKNALRLFAKIRSSIAIRYQITVDFKEFESQMHNMLNEFIGVNEIIHLSKPINIFNSVEFDKEIKRIQGTRAKADTIRSTLDKTITEVYDENPAYYDELSKKINHILEEYKASRISEEEYLKGMEDIAKDAQKKSNEQYNNHYPESIRNSRNTMAIYDNIKQYFEHITTSPTIAEDLSIKFNSIIKSKIKPDWQSNADVHKQIKMQIFDTLWDLKHHFNDDQYNAMENEITEHVLKIAISRYK